MMRGLSFSEYMGILSKKYVFSGPQYVEISPVGYCNFKCVQCHQRHHLKNENNAASKKDLPFDRLKSFVKELAKLGAREIELCGRGEPTLYPHLLELVKVIKANGLYCRLMTNASLLTPDLTDKLLAAELDNLTVSMYAGREETFREITGSNASFSEIVDNVLNFKRRSQKTSLRIIWYFQKNNFGDLEEINKIANLFEEKDQCFSSIFPYSESKILDYFENEAERPDVSNPVFSEALAALQKKNIPIHPALPLFTEHDNTLKTYYECPCYAGWWGMFLAEDGTIRPCSNSGLVLGDMNKSSARDIWFSERYREFRRQALSSMIKTRSPLPGCYCTHCGWTPFNVQVNKLMRNKGRTLFGFFKKSVKKLLTSSPDK